ncbi:hypothetical protein L1S34_07225 [Flavobacterium sp. K77]|uniref:hypothetical protein n=1 Tax=Flavobacterium sp. K77 TaxID=2910676 RepID=UPI001F304D83|nr:hypothetical protein [Flavobacterium sp. K77]MCF6141072.1 hypothetical protein [Flavobacterium sp. K77]
MKQSTKNKIRIVVWILLLGLFVFPIMEQSIKLREKVLTITLLIIAALMNILSSNRKKKDFTLLDDILIIRKTFSKEKQYSLKNISFWTENQYQFLGFKTSREIIIKTTEGIFIQLFEKNSKDFDKISEYLNSNLPNAFENYH